MSKLKKRANRYGRTDAILIIEKLRFKNYLLLVTTIKITVAFPNTETSDIKP